MDPLYAKFQDAVPNLLCMGDPKTFKSTLLNDIFGLEFEVMQEQATGLFHDSVDVIFSSNALPIELNLFDFQGATNLDLSLILKLIQGLPKTGVLF